MRPAGPTHWRLDGRTGWRTASAAGLTAGPGGITLDPAPGSEGDLAAPGGMLGGLRPPATVATAADGTLFAAEAGGQVIRAFVPGRAPEIVVEPGEHVDDRTLGRVSGLAVAAGALVVVDVGRRRVVEFGLPHMELREVAATDPRGGDWRPEAVAAGPRGAYVLDAAAGRVWRWPEPDGAAAWPVVRRPAARGRWSAIAVDRDGAVYLYDAANRRLDVVGPDGTEREPVTAPAAVRDRFADPGVVWRDGAFRSPAWPEGVWFDPRGEPVEPPRPNRRHVAAGTWTAAVLDSQVHRCVWDRVVLSLGSLPPATSVAVDTAALREPEVGGAPGAADVARLPDEAWDEAGSVTGSPSEPGGTPRELDWPVRSAPARYLALRLRLRLRAGGAAAPVVSSLLVHYPRVPASDRLPRVLTADPVARDFLDRFLGALGVTSDDLDRRIADLPALADPAAVPAGDALRFLASWFGVTRVDGWDERRQRAWLAANLEVLRRRGTPAAIRVLVAACLRNLRDDDPDADSGAAVDEGGYPVLVEGFRVRNRRQLGIPARGASLWGPSAVSRLRLGDDARVGVARLVSVGVPERDVLDEYAHRLTVYVPSAWVRTDDDERVLRRVLTAETPAHVQARLCLVEPALRVGTQASVGLDTVVGGVPRGRLACRAGHPGPCADAGRTGRIPHARLGFDLVLGGTAGAALQVGAVRVGSD